MRIRKTVKIDDREYVIRELTVREIINLFQETIDKASEAGAEKTTDITFFKEEVERFLKIAVEGGFKTEDLMDMAPSEIDLLFQEFKEVNEVFFRIARSVGIEKTVMKMLDELRALILKDFSERLVISSKLAITRPSITDIPTS